MSVRLRLRRQGRKGHPFYHIVAADARVARDGKFLEKVGSYNPTANPAVIEVDHDKAIKWLQNGAQPTNTVKAILRYTGVNLKYALIKQGKSQEDIDRIFTRWMNEKLAKIDAKKDRISEEKANALKKALAHEADVKAAKEAAIIAKNTPPAPEAPEAPEEPAAEEEAAAETEGE
ncbi:MAG: 30S ribosomal protein S16 [Bacteroidetes bacterium]|nr:30S ribosomal protein S16 [Bacteroidota bacterium]MBL0015412.1 30S ribosomal protein S16 [Bacteroidota bacterium]MBP6639800.1 30S ribosomal protein S16 [Bacteroidia bacterium]MBP6721787.1 30S ribosomal protein S16 [Bacteroidia bacterium]